MSADLHFIARSHFDQCAGGCRQIFLRSRLSGSTSCSGERPSNPAGRCDTVFVYFPEPSKHTVNFDFFACFFQSWLRASPWQLTKPQLLSVLPLLIKHLDSDNYVTYTYAAITIDRILFIRQNGQLLCVRLSASVSRINPILSLLHADLHKLTYATLLLNFLESCYPRLSGLGVRKRWRRTIT